MWKSWNFSEDMILESAKLASGKSSPIAYMNGILSNWKNKGVFSLESVPDAKSTDDSQESYNREYERRTSLATSKAQKNMDKANATDGFTAILGRLSGIEKDLAFAESSGDETALKNLENEQAELTANAEKLLSSINLTMRDLSPRFACEKCSDTGYVGTHRCDCFNNKV
jgi:hypothetical protein